MPKFDTVGTHQVVLRSVTDTNGCSSDLAQSVNVEVARAPTLAVPAAEHYCVGATTKLTVEAVKPWTLSYDYNHDNGTSASEVIDSHKMRTWTKSNGLHYYAASDGTLTVKLMEAGSVKLTKLCHEDDLCCSSLDNVVTVKPIPRVRVNAGQHDTQVVREGNRASMHITFTTGQPPFWFTYVRKDGRHELERRTVDDIQVHEYT